MINLNDVSIFSFFSGSGLLDLGFEDANFDIVFVNEFFKPFLDAYRYSRENINKHTPKYGYSLEDINSFLNNDYLNNLINKEKKDNKLVGFIGGPPCPDFSVGGKNKGRHGDNGLLSETYINLICQENPDFFLFENVKGLWRTKKHRAFYDELTKRLMKCGYYISENLINTIEFGVPQDRERILLFGCKKELVSSTNTNEQMIITFPWKAYKLYDKDNIFSKDWPKSDTFVEDSYIDCPQNIEKSLTVEYWFKKNQVYSHPNSNDCFKPRGGLTKMKSIEEGDVSKKSYKRLHRWRYSPTVAYGNNEVHLHPYKIRRISVAEALALQSLPRNFVLPPNMSLTNKFKTIGNGVPYLAGKGIAKSIALFLKGVLK